MIISQYKIKYNKIKEVVGYIVFKGVQLLQIHHALLDFSYQTFVGMELELLDLI